MNDDTELKEYSIVNKDGGELTFVKDTSTGKCYLRELFLDDVYYHLHEKKCLCNDKDSFFGSFADELVDFLSLTLANQCENMCIRAWRDVDDHDYTIRGTCSHRGNKITVKIYTAYYYNFDEDMEGSLNNTYIIRRKSDIKAIIDVFS